MPTSELDALRAAMDVLNRRLVDVLHDRARLCRRIGAGKRAAGAAAADPTREQQMLAALLQQLPPDGFAADELAAILRTVFATSRALVERTVEGGGTDRGPSQGPPRPPHGACDGRVSG